MVPSFWVSTAGSPMMGSPPDAFAYHRYSYPADGWLSKARLSPIQIRLSLKVGEMGAAVVLMEERTGSKRVVFRVASFIALAESE